MRRAGIGITLIIGGLVLTGAAWAQFPDGEEQGANEKSMPSSSGEAGLGQSSEDEGQGRDYRAPGVYVWKDRLPSMVELQAAITHAPARAKSQTSSVVDAPDFQNDRVKLYIGKLPKPESLRIMLGSRGGGR